MKPRGPGRAFSGRRVNVARTTALVFGANIASSLLGAVRSLYLARTMLPRDYGIWSLVSAAIGYANYADVGLNTGFIIRVSSLLGRGEVEEANRLKRHTLTASLFIPGAVTAALLLVLLAPARMVEPFALTIAIVALSVLPLSLVNYAQVIARLDDWWLGIGVATSATALVATVVVLATGLWTGRVSVEVAATAAVLGSVAAVVILLWHRPIMPAWPPDVGAVWRLICIGLPVSLFPIGFVLFQSLDRWIVAGSVSADDLGFYGLGTTLGAFLYTVPTTLSVILFTRQLADFGATGDPAASESIVLPPIQASAYVMAVLAGGALLWLPYLIAHFTPAYGRTLTVAGLQIVGNCLLFAVPVGANYLISIERQRTLFVLLAGAMVVEAGLVAALVSAGWGINGAATAVLASDAAFSAVVALTCFGQFGHGFLAALRNVALCFLPFALSLPVAVALRSYLPVGRGPVADAVTTAGFSLVYVALAVGLCLGAARITGLFRQPFLAARLRSRLPAAVAAALIGRS